MLILPYLKRVVLNEIVYKEINTLTYILRTKKEKKSAHIILHFYLTAYTSMGRLRYFVS